MPTIDLYTWGTPNGLKPILMLEELGVPYTLKPINIGKGDQHEPAYRAINPNGKIPAMVDGEAGVTIFESGAVLQYLAEKHGRFLPPTTADRMQAMSWLFFQVGGVGPMFGQATHFVTRDDSPYAKKRYLDEVERLYAVLDKRLSEAPFLAGAEYSIADIATWTWVRDPTRLGLSLDRWPSVQQWAARIAERPAVQRTLAIKFG
jgi:GST-like protein